MKRVVLLFTLFLFTLSNAFRPESLDLTTRILNHYHHHLDHDHQLENNPSSDGSDSSNTLIPIETSTVPDHTGSYEVEFKEAVSTPVYPVQMKDRVYFPVYRFNPVRCRKFSRFMRYPNRYPVLYHVLQDRDVGRKFPELVRMFGQRHHHVDHHDLDEDHDHEVEIEEDHGEERGNELVKKRKEKHHHHDHEHDDEHYDDRKKRMVIDVLKNMRKEKHDDDEHDDDHKKRKVKLVLKKKRQEKHDDDDEHDDDKVELKDVVKKIRKFMDFF